MAAQEQVLRACRGIGAHQPLAHRRQRGRQFGRHGIGCHLRARKDVVVDRDQGIELGLARGREAVIGGPQRDEHRGTALGRRFVGTHDRQERRHRFERGIRVPHVVAGEEDRLLVRIAQRRAVLLHVADGAEILDLAEAGVARLRLAQLARQGELALVVHRLIGKADEGISIDRRVDLADQFRRERLADIDAANTDTELGMQLFVVELGHGLTRADGI